MSGVWGKNISLSVFGESHSEAIGVILGGIPSGIRLDFDKIKKEMSRRAPNGGEYSTPRKEADEVEILSGVMNGITEGTPICAVIRNTNTKSGDYDVLKSLMRPSHSDYGYFVKYGGFNDHRGGGASSGRLTATLVFAGAVVKQILAKEGISVVSHILSVADVEDKRFDTEITDEQVNKLAEKVLPLLDESKAEEISRVVAEARADGDSVGGRIECAVLGVKAGVGEPFFDSVESVLSGLLFSVPAVKGIEFGNGFAITQTRGSQANDQMYYKDGKVRTFTNNNGGVCGGITNGMPVVFNVAIKPTASIFKPQNTVNVSTGKDEVLELKGRHDPCIVVRAVPVIEAVAALGIYDLLRSVK